MENCYYDDIFDDLEGYFFSEQLRYSYNFLITYQCV